MTGKFRIVIEYDQHVSTKGDPKMVAFLSASLIYEAMRNGRPQNRTHTHTDNVQFYDRSCDSRNAKFCGWVSVAGQRQSPAQTGKEGPPKEMVHLNLHGENRPDAPIF